MFETMIEGWFEEEESAHGNFKEALPAREVSHHFKPGERIRTVRCSHGAASGAAGCDHNGIQGTESGERGFPGAHRGEYTAADQRREL